MNEYRQLRHVMEGRRPFSFQGIRIENSSDAFLAPEASELTLRCLLSSF